MWVAPAARHLDTVREPQPSADIVRWARVDLAAVRAEAARWQRAEGPGSPEETRPLSDRVLGLLGWVPQTTSLTLERRKTPDGWSERLVFGTSGAR